MSITDIYMLVGFAVLALLILASVAKVVYGKADVNQTVSNIALLCLGTGLGLLIVLSLFMSTQFGYTILPDLHVWGAVYFFSLAIIQAGASFGVGTLIYAQKYIAAVVCGVVVVVCVSLSILAGQANTSGQQTAERQERIKASDEYQAALQARRTAQDKAERLAVSEADYNNAKINKANAEKELKVFMSGTAHNSSGKRAGMVSNVIRQYGCNGFYGGLCAERDAIQARINAAQATIDDYRDYAGAKAHANTLKAEALPVPASAENPRFVFASRVTGIPADVIEAYAFTWLCIILDVMALCLSLIFPALLAASKAMSDNGGQSKTPAPRTDDTGKPLDEIPAAKVEKFNLGGFSAPVPTAATGARLMTDGLIHGHKDEIVVPKHLTPVVSEFIAAYLDSNHKAGNMQSVTTDASVITHDDETVITDTSVTTHGAWKPRKSTNKRIRGKRYPCDFCGNTYTCYKSDHRHCSPDCRAKNHGFDDEEHVKREVNKKRRKVEA